MKNILFLVVLLMSGCSVYKPLVPKFPDIPVELQIKCPQLESIEKEQVYLSDLMKTVTKNYTKYYTCAELVEAWQDWYTKQKSNADTVKK